MLPEPRPFVSAEWFAPRAPDQERQHRVFRQMCALSRDEHAEIDGVIWSRPGSESQVRVQGSYQPG